MLHSLKIKYLVFILMVVSGYFNLYFIDISSAHTLCLFKNITGLPCPSCGSTRATVLLLHGHFISSILLNPLALFTNILVIIACIWMIKDINNNNSSLMPFLRRKWNNKLLIASLILLCANWVWNIQKGL